MTAGIASWIHLANEVAQASCSLCAIIWTPTGILSTLNIGIVTQGAPIIDDAKLKIGSPVGRSVGSTWSSFQIGAGPGHESVIIPSSTDEQHLWASRAYARSKIYFL